MIHEIKATDHFSFEDMDLTPVFQGNDPVFPAKQVCQILGIKHYRNSISRLDDDERAYVSINTLGGKQKVACVTEAGLYHLIFKSKSEQARKFRRWVTHEVLPQLRKHGFYVADDLLKKLREEQGYVLNLHERAAKILFDLANGKKDD